MLQNNTEADIIVKLKSILELIKDEEDKNKNESDAIAENLKNMDDYNKVLNTMNYNTQNKMSTLLNYFTTTITNADNITKPKVEQLYKEYILVIANLPHSYIEAETDTDKNKAVIFLVNKYNLDLNDLINHIDNSHTASTPSR